MNREGGLNASLGRIADPSFIGLSPLEARPHNPNAETGLKLSVVIPALNEERAIGDVLQEIPISDLRRMGYEVEVIVVDNGSIDNTFHIACMNGATVVMQPARGYGNAYRAGFAYSNGDVVATGDADLTYPFSDLPKILRRMELRDLEFVNTDRLGNLRNGVMTRSHVFGNWLLSVATRVLFGWPYNDSQSGMWVFRRYVWDALDVQSSGMPFSQELKIEAFVKGFRCDEVPIEYRARAGKEKLNTIGDGLGNVVHLVKKRISLGIAPIRSGAATRATGSGCQGSSTSRRVSAAPGNDDVLTDWDERWYERSVRGSLGERGPHVPVTTRASVDAAATSSSERKRLVVWRARSTASIDSVASSTPGQTGRRRFIQPVDGNAGFSPN